MAKNIIMGGINQTINIVDLLVTISPESTAAHALSGDPVIATGNIPGVAENDYDSVTGLTPVNVHCIAELVVKGVGPSGNAAISAGDGLYMQTDGTIDKNSGGSGAVKFGLAFGNALQTGNNLGTDTRSGQLVASGNITTTIRVWVGKITF